MLQHSVEGSYLQPRRHPVVWAAVGLVFMALALVPGSARAISAPSVSALSVASGPVSGGTYVAITGTGFTNTLSVTFGGLPAPSFSVANDSLVYAFSPAHAAGAVHVIVTTSAGSSTATYLDVFTYGGVAWVSSVSPGGGSIYGGTLVTVSGSGFLGASVVTFGGFAGTNLVVYSDNYLTVISPAHAVGVVDVLVWVGGVPSPSTATDTFIYGYGYGFGATVTGVSPSIGPAAGGTLVRVTGAGFTGATAVTFGDAGAVAPSVLSDSQLLVVSPPHAPGTVDVRVWVGGFGSPLSPADLFAYVPGITPVVTGVSPNNGPPTGGTMVTVSGSGFTGATAVMFGTAAGTNLTVLSDTRLTVTSPAHAAGAVDVLVVVSGTTSATGAADLFTFLTPPPSNPPSRFVGSVTINGQPAPSGTVVEVRIGSVTCGATTTFLSGGQSRYVLDSPPQDAAHPGCGSDGTAVAFFVGGAKADQAGTWRSYDLNTVDLTLTTAPAPAPTPTPTSPAPLPPSAGTGSALGAGPGSPAVWIALMVIGAATLLGGSVVAGGKRRAAVVPVSQPAAEVVPPPMIAPVPSRSIASAERGHRTSQGWWAAAAVGAAAVAVTLLVARNRR